MTSKELIIECSKVVLIGFCLLILILLTLEIIDDNFLANVATIIGVPVALISGWIVYCSFNAEKTDKKAKAKSTENLLVGELKEHYHTLKWISEIHKKSSVTNFNNSLKIFVQNIDNLTQTYFTIFLQNNNLIYLFNVEQLKKINDYYSDVGQAKNIKIYRSTLIPEQIRASSFMGFVEALSIKNRDLLLEVAHVTEKELKEMDTKINSGIQQFSLL